MSAPTLLLISASAISLPEFKVFAENHGALFTNSHLTQFRISKETSHVWIYWGSEELESIVRAKPQIVLKTVGKPVVMVTLEMSSDERAKNMALQFANAFLQRWSNSAMSYFQPYSKDEVADMLASGKNLSDLYPKELLVQKV